MALPWGRRISVFGVQGLTRDAERVSDLLPRPAALPGQPDAARLDLLGQPVQRAHRPQPDRRVVGVGGRVQLGNVHTCQVKLTPPRVSSQTYTITVPTSPPAASRA